MTRRIAWLLPLVAVALGACLRRDISVHHPVTHLKIERVAILPVDNHTVYDDEPFRLEKGVRRLLRQRYDIRTAADKGDVSMKLIFIDFRRGNLRLLEQNDAGRNLSALAELVLLDDEGKVLRRSRLGESEFYEDRESGDFEEAQERLLSRLAERLVVDLFED